MLLPAPDPLLSFQGHQPIASLLIKAGAKLDAQVSALLLVRALVLS